MAARGVYDRQLGPHLARTACELRAVDFAGKIDVREKHINLVAIFQISQRRVGRVGVMHVKATRCERVANRVADQKLIFN